MQNKAQLTIFVIVAIVAIGLVVGFFMLKDTILQDEIPASMVPIQTTFLSCIEDKVLVGIDILESQGGYIYLPDFEPGSKYMPFSSQLDFLGNPIPYWYYVSGNNIQKEQVPSRNEMEEQLSRYLEEKINECRFDGYYDEGFEINLGNPEADININDREVEVNLDLDLGISREESVLLKNHKVVVDSNLGKLYKSAKEIYEQEQETLFLENYGVDVLRLYAPVDGVDLTCSPKVWAVDDVFDDLELAIESNTLALKTNSGSYTLDNENDKYFITDVSVEEDVRFLNSRNWPSAFEVAPSEERILISKPVGNQPGLGALGFCYVPYHFVYNMKYPVLVQIMNGEEIFQFPMAVVIQGNKPRQALDVDAVDVDVPKLCEYKNTLVEVNTYDTDLNPVVADISFECFGKTCDIGESPLESLFPQCANGYIVAKADGFKDTRKLYSTTESGSVDVILDRLYEKEIELNLDGGEYNKDALISFMSEDSSKTIIYPSQKSVELSEGQYTIQVYIYKNSSIRLAETKKQQCIDVPETGIVGLFGGTTEKCFDITIPAQIVSNALSGGGQQEHYILESDLVDSEVVEINAQSLPSPTSIEQLQNNYILYEERGLDINFD